MSFLGDLIGTIGGDKPSAPSAKPVARPAIVRQRSTAPIPAVRDSPSVKPEYKGTMGGPSTSSISLKRKADDALSDQTRSLKINAADSKQSTTKSSTTSPSSQNGSSKDQTPSKAPVRGSYAQMLARAKEAQQTKGASQIGVIKHQSTDKSKSSKLAERRKEEQEKSTATKGKLAAHSQPGSAGTQRSRSPLKKTDVPKVVSAPKPPLHGPPRPAKPEYKGTMGLSASRSKEIRRPNRPSKRDEYLATDEEDNSELDDAGSYDGYSDASSDMEGGYDDVQKEEELALRAARADDARELAMENEHKKKKEEMKKKMAALAAKHKK